MNKKIEIIQWFDCDGDESKIPIVYRKCMNAIKSEALSSGMKYTLLTDKINMKHYTDCRFASNDYRLELLIQNPNRWWLDADMLPTGHFADIPFESNFPYCYNGRGVEGAIYANGCKDIMSNWSAAVNSGINIIAVLYNNIKQYRNIPEGYLLHIHLGCLLGNGRMKNVYCNLKNNDNGELDFESINGYDITRLRG